MPQRDGALMSAAPAAIKINCPEYGHHQDRPCMTEGTEGHCGHVLRCRPSMDPMEGPCRRGALRSLRCPLPGSLLLGTDRGPRRDVWQRWASLSPAPVLVCPTNGSGAMRAASIFTPHEKAGFNHLVAGRGCLFLAVGYGGPQFPPSPTGILLTAEL